MQPNETVEKKRLLFNGIEPAGLISVQELNMEMGTVDVPSFNYIRPISNGVIKWGPMDVTYTLHPRTNTREFWHSYFFERLVYDVVIIRTDGHGVEVAHTTLGECECTKYTEPEYKAEAPALTVIQARITPYDVEPLGAR